MKIYKYIKLTLIDKAYNKFHNYMNDIDVWNLSAIELKILFLINIYR